MKAMDYLIDPRHRLSLLTAVVLILGSCSDGTSFPGHQDPIELAVRMHLVQSDQLEELNVGLSNAEVTGLLAAVNEIWAQAAVVWSLERPRQLPSSKKSR